MEIAVERYIAGFASNLDESGADVLNMDLKNMGGVETQAGDVQRGKWIDEFLKNCDFVVVLHVDEGIRRDKLNIIR